MSDLQTGRRPRKVTPLSLAALKPGDQVYYRPPSATRPYAGQRAQVVRAPRLDVKSPSLRLKFQDGAEKTVPVRQVGREGQPEVAPYLVDARSRPSWKRLVAQLVEAGKLEAAEAPGGADLRQAAEQRARQLAGMVVPKGSEASKKVDVARVLLEAAQVEATAAAARQGGRAGRGPVRPVFLPDPTQDVDTARLNQDQRAMINNIARCIHLRYFLSDAEGRAGARVPGVLQQIVREAARPLGGTDLSTPSGGKKNAVAGIMEDSLRSAYQLALEACQQLDAGQTDHARALARQVQEHRLTYLTANAELEKYRVKHHTGRYFHGDVLSVRLEHDGGGMTQFYARVTFVYAEDGHTLIVANAAEIESLTATRVGAQGWASLCRWVEDTSERAGGRKQGRRQDDDEHLIYRDHDGYLELRPTLAKYPDLLRALEAVRRSLMIDERQKDIDLSEIPEHHPAPGYHPPVPTGSQSSP
ncbi:hypothetical protein [Deinococcus budaensis]|uniref:Uncharacterized protein n=1 Tax=Deinococcus budaensis TaxID=1665626 RepID=A0A7W8GFW1_9DEIO|nr:hypothetical protein [Deinococcus budaensis]MBB5234451.1 hypothetical protein [Deinococcus budaensis]